MAANTGLGTSVGDHPAIERTRALRSLYFLPLALMAAIVFVTYAAIVWTLRRGFDWIDEPFVYTMIASNRMGIGEPWGFQYLLHPLYILTGESVLTFRILRLVGYILLSIVLVWCAQAVVRRIGINIPRSGWAFILLLAQVGTFFAWSFSPRYLSYNELGSWLAQLGVTLIVLALVWGVSSPHDRRASWVLWAIWVGLGAVTTLLVFAKVTSGVALGAFLVLALVIPNPNLRLWKRVVGAGAGTSIALFVLWVCKYPFVFYLKNTLALLFDKSGQDAIDHPISVMINTYVHSVLSTGLHVSPPVLLFGITMLTFRLRVKPTGANAKAGTIDRITWILGVLLLITLTGLTRFQALTALTDVEKFVYLGNLIVFIGAAGVIGLMILGRNGTTTCDSGKNRSYSVAIGGSAVVAAPFISAIGTNTLIVGEFIFAATIYAVVLGIALVLLAEGGGLARSGARRLPLLIACIVILMAASGVIANIAKPFRTAPLLSQGTSTSVPELRGLLLTKTDAAWIDWVSAAGDSLGADNIPATAMNSPGALYAFNHSGYASPNLDPTQGHFNSLGLACSMNPPSDLFLLQPGTVGTDDPSADQMKKNLATCGINFPGDFRVVDQRIDADPKLTMTIWSLKSR